MFFFGFNAFHGLRSLILFPLSILAAWWAWRDARQRNLSPWLSAGVAFSLFPIGFVIYLIYRSFSNRNRL